MTLVVVSVFLAMYPPIVASPAPEVREVRFSESWSDPNFVLCSGVGIHGSGRVAVTAIGIANGEATQLSYFNVSVTSAQSSFSASGRIFWMDENGREQSETLTEPWFDSISRLGSRNLILPRVTTSAKGPGPWEARTITVGQDRRIRIEVNTMFAQAGGTCTAGFDEIWTLPMN